MAKKKGKKKGAKKKADKKKKKRIQLKGVKNQKKGKKKGAKKKEKGKKKKEDKKKKSSAKKPTFQDHSSNYSVLQAVKKVRSLETLAHVEIFIKGENRKTILRVLPGVRRKLGGN